MSTRFPLRMTNPSDALLDRVRRALPDGAPDAAPDTTPRVVSFEGRPEAVERVRSLRPTASDATSTRGTASQRLPERLAAAASAPRERAESSTIRQALVAGDGAQQSLEDGGQRAVGAYRAGADEAPPPPSMRPRTSA